ncbi:MAG: hypothetical protein ACJ78Q_19770 [Chloroflexia bacterium]
MLKAAEGVAQNGKGLTLSWLEGVQERAVKQTGELSAQKLAEAEARLSSRTVEAEPEPKTEPLIEPEAGATAQAGVAGEGAVKTGEVPQVPAVPGEGAPDEPPPEWVVGILEPQAPTPAPADQAYEPEEMSHIMPWMTAGASAGDAPSTTSTSSGAQGLPPWLGDVTVQETLQARSVEADPAATEDLLLELEGLEPFAPPTVDETVSQSGPNQEAPDEGQAKTEQVPEWLKSLAPKPEDDEYRPPTDFENINLITKVRLSPSDTLGQPIMASVPVRPPRPGSVETLAALVQAPDGTGVGAGQAQEGVRSAEQRERGFLKWLMPDGIIFLVVLVVLLLVLALRLPFGTLNAPAAPDALDFYRAIEAAPADKPVLVVYDWDAGLSAEMSALAAAVTNHLMSRRVHFVTMSTVPQGPGFAQQITAAAAGDAKANYGYEYGRDYLVLGYVPGGEAALASMASDIATLMPLDYVKSRKVESFDLMQSGNLKSLRDFGLVIDLASDEASLRNWIEQASTRTGVPLVAAVPQALEPLARPYKGIAGPGLKAVVSGQAGASQYLKQLADARRISAPQFSADELNLRVNTQVVAQLLVIVAIIGAFVSMGVKRIWGGKSA